MIFLLASAYLLLSILTWFLWVFFDGKEPGTKELVIVFSMFWWIGFPIFFIEKIMPLLPSVGIKSMYNKFYNFVANLRKQKEGIE